MFVSMQETVYLLVSVGGGVGGGEEKQDLTGRILALCGKRGGRCQSIIVYELGYPAPIRKH